jgi:hypothetical protein
VDKGVITAQDGKIHRVSANAFPPADLTYKFEGSHLITFDPVRDAAPVSWTLMGSKEKSGSHSHSSGGESSEGTTVHHPSGGDWRNLVPSNWRGRIGF